MCKPIEGAYKIAAATLTMAKKVPGAVTTGAAVALLAAPKTIVDTYTHTSVFAILRDVDLISYQGGRAGVYGGFVALVIVATLAFCQAYRKTKSAPTFKGKVDLSILTQAIYEAYALSTTCGWNPETVAFASGTIGNVRAAWLPARKDQELPENPVARAAPSGFIAGAKKVFRGTREAIFDPFNWFALYYFAAAESAPIKVLYGLTAAYTIARAYSPAVPDRLALPFELGSRKIGELFAHTQSRMCRSIGNAGAYTLGRTAWLVRQKECPMIMATMVSMIDFVTHILPPAFNPREASLAALITLANLSYMALRRHGSVYEAVRSWRDHRRQRMCQTTAPGGAV